MACEAKQSRVSRVGKYLDTTSPDFMGAMMNRKSHTLIIIVVLNLSQMVYLLQRQ
jgi:hypothetical protein